MAHTPQTINESISDEHQDGYKEMVDFYLKIGEEIPSFGREQCSIVFTKLLERTRHKISMVLSSFSGQISEKEDYILAFKECLNRGVEVNILFLDPPNEQSSVFELLSYQVAETVKMYKAKSETIEYLKKEFAPQNICHFAVFDDRFYRKEIDTINYIAVANTNDIHEVHRLNTIFNRATNKLVPYKPHA